MGRPTHTKRCRSSVWGMRSLPIGLALASLVSASFLIRCTSPVALQNTFEVATTVRMEMLTRQNSPEGFPKAMVKSPELVWISLDGLTTSLIDGFIKRQKEAGVSLHPHGLRFLREQLPASVPLQVVDATITAASHTSTITCSPPLRHGIVGNSVWNGERSESGFGKPYNTETFVHALRQSGLRVGSAGYPGFDGQSDNRTADWAMAYNANRNDAQFINLGASFNEVIQIADDTNLSESQFPVRVRSTKAPGLLEVLTLKGDRLGEVSKDAWSDLLLHGPNATRLVSMRIFDNSLYISPTSQNRIDPDSLRHELDAAGLVFPSGKDFGVQSRFGDEAFLLTMEHRLHYFTQMAHTFLERGELDALFLYFEDLDVLGHSYSGYEDKLPVVDAHMRRFDRYLGSVLARLEPGTNLVILGDHGMTAIDMVLNPTELIPETLRSQIVLRASGGTLWVYGADKTSLLKGAPTHETWFDELTAALSDATLPGNPSKRIFTSVDVIDQTRRDQAGAADDLPLPWIQATTATDIGLKVSVEPGLLVALREYTVIPKELLERAIATEDGRLPPPTPAGQHGHLSSESSMLTHLFAKGPALERAFALSRPASRPLLNTRVVPKVAQALGWPAPESCR